MFRNLLTRPALAAMALSLAIIPAAQAQEVVEKSLVMTRSDEAVKVENIPANSPGYSADIRLRVGGEWAEGKLEATAGKRRYTIGTQTTIVDIPAGEVLIMDKSDGEMVATRLPLKDWPYIPDASDLGNYRPEKVTWETDENFGANPGAFTDGKEREFQLVEVVGTLPSGNEIFGMLSFSDDGVIDTFHGVIENEDNKLSRVTHILTNITMGEPAPERFMLPDGAKVMEPK